MIIKIIFLAIIVVGNIIGIDLTLTKKYDKAFPLVTFLYVITTIYLLLN